MGHSIPDSKYVASVGWKEGVVAVHVWNATDGVQIKIFRLGPRTIEAIIWKNNTLYIAVLEKPDRLSKIKAQVIDIESEKRVTINHDWSCFHDLERVVWSPDGECIAFLFGDPIYEGSGEEAVGIYTSYRNVEIRAASTGEKVREYVFDDAFEGTAEVPPIAWSPDSTRIAVGFYEEVSIWEMTTQQVILTFPAYTPWESEIVWSPDGRYLAIGYEGEVKIFNALTGVGVLAYINRSRVKVPPLSP